MKKNLIIFIGKQNNNQKVEIKSKPSFFDALQLSTQSPHTTGDIPYQSIPFYKKAIIPIQINNSNIQISYHRHHHSLQIVKEDIDLTEKEVFELLNHFAIKEDNKVSFLAVFPNSKRRLKGARKASIRAESRELKEEER
ncbi:hypothetical protein [Bacillus sp. AFS031507]|uniref:hypothetical protein n=1 Tax=Bacillus sp. AFS031507 TaxID=2033496 RepID=UPI000BFB3EB5|nr:hypothetical protein [Bacillus sp. AFS031507]PGY12590.1 hypothetical protein COE25_09490 [Bacillus sp. AFS031507]